ncbi:MAG: VWA domain-containing protein [Lachnospiraceae bacterium]|nr:VWA domain-containing protein [Lachnospiraceae bacterium]
MREGLTEIVFIIDRSGSMGGLEYDTNGGFNSMIEKQKKEEGEAIVSTVLFDDRSEVIYDRVDLKKVEPMNDTQYYVRGCTALLDALGGAVKHIKTVHKYAREDDRPEKTVFIVTTDGMENSSRKYDYDEVRKMVEKQRKEAGWEFIFLGANLDSVEYAGRMGFSAKTSVNYESDSRGTLKNYEVLGRTLSAVRCAKRTENLDDIVSMCCEEIREDYSKRHKRP